MARKKKLLLKSAKIGIGSIVAALGGVACVISNPKGVLYDVGFCIPQEQLAGTIQNGVIVEVLPPYPGDLAIRCDNYSGLEACAPTEACYYGPFENVPPGATLLLTPPIASPVTNSNDVKTSAPDNTAEE